MRIGFRRKQAASERLWLGAFGKHPAWDDHFDSPGLETTRLTQLRAALYSEGIGGRIDTGVWDKLEPEERVEAFAHTLVWRTSDGLLAARLIDSVDGKGRRRYPLVVVAHTQGASGAWVCGALVERLAQVARRCASLETSDEVLAEIELTRGELRAEAGLLGEPEEIIEGENAMQSLTACAGEEAVQRVLYQCRRDMRGFLRGALRGDRSSSRTIDITSKECRAPACGSSPGEACGLWLRAMDHLLGDTVPLMVIVHDSMEMADILVGEPEAGQFYCLRAGTAALPLASEVPYEIDPETRAWVASLLEGGVTDRDQGWVSANGRR